MLPTVGVQVMLIEDILHDVRARQNDICTEIPRSRRPTFSEWQGISSRMNSAVCGVSRSMQDEPQRGALDFRAGAIVIPRRHYALDP